MKLWVKFLLSTTSVLGVGAASLGSVYAFSQIRDSDDNNIVKKNEVDFKSDAFFDKNIKAEDIEANFLALDAFSPTKDFFIAKYNYKNNSVYDFAKRKSFSWNEYRDSFVASFNAPPKLIINLGSVIFKNEYVDAVSPKDFVDFVKWFIEENAWGPEFFTMNEFTIFNGVKREGGGVILGDHSDEHKEKTQIGFYPDAFFKINEIYREPLPSLISKVEANPQVEKTHEEREFREFNEEEIKEFLKNENKQSRIRYIENIDEREGEVKYYLYTDVYKNLLDDIAKKYPYLQKINNGLYVEYDENGKGTLKNGEYLGFDLDSIIPKIALAGITYDNFDGIGNDWIKFVTAHEYGHHTTLQEAKDVSDKFVALGATNTYGYQDTSLFKAEMFENFLKAKNKNLGFEFTDVYGNKTNNGPYFRFTINGELEKTSDIYGYETNENKDITQEQIDAALKNSKRRKALVWEDDLDENQNFLTLENAAKEKGITPFDIYLMNAWDYDDNTLSPHIPKKPAQAYDSNGQLKPIEEIFENVDKRPKRKYFSFSYFAGGWNHEFEQRRKTELTDEKIKDEIKASHPDYDQIFSDYTFNPAELINRDFLQITYNPSKKLLKNRPEGIEISEYNSGYEFYLDSTPFKEIFTEDNMYPYFANLKTNIDLGFFELDFPFWFRMTSTYGLNSDSYMKNGFFKDDFYKRSLGAEIYDPQGNPVKDTNIGIKDLNGKVVEDRAKAIWIYLLKTKLIGNSDVSGFWRNSNLDKMYFWGYLKKDSITDKISKIKFINQKTGKSIYININKNVDNMFYFKQRGKNPQKHTLADEGFVSWSTNYETIGDFQDSKLEIGGKYFMEFVDENNNFIKNVDLGSKKFLTENGKRYNLSPVKIINRNNKSEISVERQFR